MYPHGVKSDRRASPTETVKMPVSPKESARARKHNKYQTEKPQIPENWDYDESIDKVKEISYKWKGLTEDLAKELWIAREILSVSKSDAAKIMHGTFVPRKTWAEYCKEMGSSRQVVNRWLAKWYENKELVPF